MEAEAQLGGMRVCLLNERSMLQHQLLNDNLHDWACMCNTQSRTVADLAYHSVTVPTWCPRHQLFDNWYAYHMLII